MATVLTPFDIGTPDNASTPQNRSVGTSPTFNATPLSQGQGGSAVATPGASGAAMASGAHPLQNPTTTSSGSFQNIQQYLNKNQDFNQAQGGLAGEIANNVQGQAGQANQAVQGAFNQFQQGADKASAYFQPGSSDFNSLNNITANNGANAAGASSQDLANAGQLVNANYAGPTQINPTDLANLQTQYGSNLSNLGQETQSESGRFNLLNQMFGNSGYTQGQQSLDNALLQNNPQQANQLKGLQNISNQFNQNLSNTSNNAQQIGQGDTVAAQKAGQQAGQAVTGASTGLLGDVQNAANAANATYGTNYSALQQQLTPSVTYATPLGGSQNKGQAMGGAGTPAPISTNYTLTPELVNALGLNGLSSDLLNGVNLQSYLPTAAQANMQNSATQQQINNYTALQGLLGNQAGNPQLSGTAGTFDTNPLDQIQSALPAIQAAQAGVDQRVGQDQQSILNAFSNISLPGVTGGVPINFNINQPANATVPQLISDYNQFLSSPFGQQYQAANPTQEAAYQKAANDYNTFINSLGTFNAPPVSAAAAGSVVPPLMPGTTTTPSGTPAGLGTPVAIAPSVMPTALPPGAIPYTPGATAPNSVPQVTGSPLGGGVAPPSTAFSNADSLNQYYGVSATPRAAASIVPDAAALPTTGIVNTPTGPSTILAPRLGSMLGRK